MSQKDVRIFKASVLVRFQRVFWIIAICYFTLVFALYVVGLDFAPKLAGIGVFAILIGTATLLVLIAEQFRSAGVYRYSILSYSLVLILMLTVIIRYFG